MGGTPHRTKERGGKGGVLLSQAVSGTALIVIFHPIQKRFLSIPQTPICYWLRERFFDLLAGGHWVMWLKSDKGWQRLMTRASYALPGRYH